MHPARRKKWNRGSIAIVAIFLMCWAVIIVSGGCISADTKAGIGVKETTKPVDAGHDAKADDQDAQGAGNQQASDQVNSGGDTSKASSQQSGFFNFSVTDAIGTAGVGFGGSVAAWLLFAGFTRASDNKTERHESTEQTTRLKNQAEAHSKDMQSVCDAFETGMEHVSNAYKLAIAARGAN